MFEFDDNLKSYFDIKVNEEINKILHDKNKLQDLFENSQDISFFNYNTDSKSILILLNPTDYKELILSDGKYLEILMRKMWCLPAGLWWWII